MKFNFLPLWEESYKEAHQRRAFGIPKILPTMSDISQSKSTYIMQEITPSIRNALGSRCVRAAAHNMRRRLAPSVKDISC